jgi:hypothetical protein
MILAIRGKGKQRFKMEEALVESGAGILWLSGLPLPFSSVTKLIVIRVGTAVEHHVMHQYQFANTQNVFIGQIQAETSQVFYPVA